MRPEGSEAPSWRQWTRRLIPWVLLALIVIPLGFLVDFCVFWSPRPVDNLFHGKRPLVIAHRGASHVAPENTLASFRKALEMGVDALELDVMLSRDGEVVVIHDSSVDRTTDGSGPVGDLSLAQLKELDAGSWFGPQFKGERVPTLQEVIDVAGGGTVLEIELKGTSFFPTPLERSVLDLVVRNGIERKVIIQSFNPLALFYVRRANSEVATALLYHERLPLPLRQRWLISLAHPDIVQPGQAMATREHVRKMQSRGYRVVPWTVNSPPDMERLADLKIDGIITDRPDLLIDLLDGDGD